ncbi:MAG: M48 family metallopeptidase [Sedimentisphaerales bacterium]|nr:M48 family metallopeptidase [Sedimentisphaerales bacterium]
MKLPEGYILQQKDIKHARVRVSENGQVRVLVPVIFTEDDIDSLLEKKAKWVKKQQMFFVNKSTIDLSRNQLLLFGNRYHYFYDETCSQKVIVDHNFKTIRARKDLLNPEIQIKWYKTVAKQYLISRTEELSNKLHFDYNKLFLRGQKTKLGNCSECKNISLNWRLVKVPEFVSDYIIVHELVHTKVMNHTGKFWTLLKSFYPDYKDAIMWLDKYGNSL